MSDSEDGSMFSDAESQHSSAGSDVSSEKVLLCILNSKTRPVVTCRIRTIQLLKYVIANFPWFRLLNVIYFRFGIVLVICNVLNQIF